jgi:hypothetical protein
VECSNRRNPSPIFHAFNVYYVEALRHFLPPFAGAEDLIARCRVAQNRRLRLSWRARLRNRLHAAALTFCLPSFQAWVEKVVAIRNERTSQSEQGSLRIDI